MNIHTISVFFWTEISLSRSSECSIEFYKQTKSGALTLAMKDSYNSTPRRVLNQIMGAYIYIYMKMLVDCNLDKMGENMEYSEYQHKVIQYFASCLEAFSRNDFIPTNGSV